MQKKWWRLGIGAIVALVVIGMLMLASEHETRETTNQSNPTELLTQQDAASSCLSDSDCVPASCCHARTCVSISEKLRCGGIRCTQVCEPGTLDCEQARCSCIRQQCAMVPE